MKRRARIASLTGAAILFIAAGGWLVWLLSLPPEVEDATPPAISLDEHAALLAALQPPKRARPVVAVIGIKDATELTDYIVVPALIRQADVAEVHLLGTEAGSIALYPAAVHVQPDATVAEFDARHPDGADYVIVPAMTRNDDATVLAWLREQADKRATIIGVCAGARVVAAAGLLDGRRATTHWYYLDDLRRKHPQVHYVADRRVVFDGQIVTTTGITASMPTALLLIEAIAGRDTAVETARTLGVTGWDARHASARFQFTRPFAITAIRNRLSFWNHEQLGFEITPEVDEVALALVLDAWSRTFRSRAVTFASTADPLPTRHGMRLVPDRVTDRWPAERQLPALGTDPPVRALERTLQEIGDRYGEATRAFVSQQLEYTKLP